MNIANRVLRRAILVCMMSLPLSPVVAEEKQESPSLNSEINSAMWEGLHVIKGARDYVSTPMGQVHYSSLGTGQPMLLVHQTPWFSVQYAKVQPILAARGFRVLASDTPGFGFSDVPDHPPTADEYADNLAAFLDKLGIERVALVGHHTGATISAAFAARHPDRTACLVMHGVPLYTESERAERMANRLHSDTTMQRDGSHITTRWKGLEARFATGAKTESIQWSVLSFLLAGDLEWYGHQAAYTFDMAPAIMNIKAPTMVMSNTADTLHQAALRAVKMRPDFAYHEFEGGNSHMMYDYPDPWAKAVADFVVEKCAF